LGLEQGQTLRTLDTGIIGREHFKKDSYTTLTPVGIPEADAQLAEVYSRNRLRAHIAATYLREMREALEASCDVLKPGGHIVLIAGNNQLCGAPFLTQQYLSQMLLARGLTRKLALIDDIKSRGLMTRRNKTASVISSEWVHVFQKRV
jgi:hypothetical protein